MTNLIGVLMKTKYRQNPDKKNPFLLLVNRKFSSKTIKNQHSVNFLGLIVVCSRKHGWTSLQMVVF